MFDVRVCEVMSAMYISRVLGVCYVISCLLESCIKCSDKLVPANATLEMVSIVIDSCANEGEQILFVNSYVFT